MLNSAAFDAARWSAAERLVDRGVPAVSQVAERLNREISVQAHTRSEWEHGRLANRVLRRIAEGDLLVLKGVI